MQEKTITCTVCPMGCRITVRGEGAAIESVEGYTCPRGENYARAEFVHPVRILTSTALVGEDRLVPLRSSQPIPKELLLPCVAEIRKLRLEPPVRRYEVLIPNVLGTGADIVATGEAL